MKRPSIFLILILWSSAGLAVAQYCDCEIPKSRRASRIKAADQALARASLNEAEIVAKHFPFGLPKPPDDASNESILVQLEWVTWYDNDLRMPLWVGYQLNKTDARNKRYPREDCFRRDARLADAFASFCKDYDEPLYDRGHMVPANDSRRNRTMVDNSFLFSNMAPQRGNFNRKIWESLESTVNGWAEKVGVFIITGAIFDRNNDGVRDSDASARRMAPSNRVAIPTHFYKIVFHIRPDGQVDIISFLLPHNNRTHKNENRYLTSRIISIDEIEKLTGVDFFPNLNPASQEAFEGAKARSMVKWVTN